MTWSVDVVCLYMGPVTYAELCLVMAYSGLWETGFGAEAWARKIEIGLGLIGSSG